MLNEEIKSAIQEAVAAEGQLPELANKLVAWMQSLTDENEDIMSKDAYTRRCNLCFDATTISNQETYGG